MKESGPVWETLRRLPQRLGKFKYPVLILLLGVLLLLLPARRGGRRSRRQRLRAVEERSTLAVEETRLANLLSRIQGAGAVEVMLSLKSGSNPLPNRYAAQTGGSTEESLRQEDQYGPVQHQRWHSRPGAAGQVTTYQGAIVSARGRMTG